MPFITKDLYIKISVYENAYCKIEWMDGLNEIFSIILISLNLSIKMKFPL